MYLVEEFANVAVFPHETSGCFNRTLIDPLALYAVHGDKLPSSHATNLPLVSSPSPSAYGAYVGPTQQVPPPRPQLAQRRKSNSYRKTIQVVSLSLPNQNKPSTSKASTHLEYKVITQIIVSLEVERCSGSIVAELVHQQVGFEVIRLDSKCFPILECESTTAIEFWKSNRRVIAASKTLYKKLTGSSTSLSNANDEIDLTHSDEEVNNPPQPKCCCLYENKKLDKILVCVEAIKNKVDLFAVISGVFECVICKDVM